MGAKQQPGRGPILFLTRALLVFFYWSLFSFNIDFSLFPFLLCFFCYLYVIYLSLLGSPLRGPRGEPPPDVVSGENVTLPSSFIALRREAITTMIFVPFLFCSYIYSLSFSRFVLFAFNKISTKTKTKIFKNSGTGTDKWVLASASSSCSHPP
jgi:hypothetical protein